MQMERVGVFISTAPSMTTPSQGTSNSDSDSDKGCGSDIITDVDGAKTEKVIATKFKAFVLVSNI